MIKQQPEDFVVEEIPNFILKDTGDYTVFKVTKRLLTTEDAIAIISRRFNILRKNIKYAGMKDRNAITTQYISIYHGNKSLSIDGKDLKVEFIGYSDEPLSLGSLKGNKFTIIVRDIDKKLNNINVKPIQIPNYFDEQRFSTNNFKIGLHILKNDFKSACDIIINSDDSFSGMLSKHIENSPNDYANALKLVPKKILSMYLHAVQSLIFNDALSRMIKDDCIDDSKDFVEIKYGDGVFIFDKDAKYEGLPDELEMVGFDSRPTNKYIIEKLKSLGISPRDFIIRQIPDLSVEGSMRKCAVEIENLNAEKLDDKTFRLEFSLPKGSYATIAVKALFI